MIKAMPTPTVQVRELTLHGHKITYRVAGEGPAVVLVHGIAGTGATWEDVMGRLADRYTLIAPDLPGHGESDKPVGDYSLGSLASMLRDMLVTIGVERATMVGHSLGGGVVMQYVYQFPQRCERLVLVSSGGLGNDVNLLLRAACLPGADLFLAATAAPLAKTGDIVGGVLGRLGWTPGPDLEEVARGFASLSDTETRKAFLHTLKSVVGIEGQRVNASNKLYLASRIPTLLMSGERDPIIPAKHAEEAHELLPGSELIIFPKAGHMPYHDQPAAFARALDGFIERTQAAHISADEFGDLLRGEAEGAPRAKRPRKVSR